MTRLGRGLVAFWIAVAVWLSDRWAWTLPALGGVMGGVWFSRIQRGHRRAGSKGLSPFELGSLLILVSFIYLYVLFLLFELGRSQGRSAVGLLLGLAILPALLLGLITLAVRKSAKVPSWLSRCWDWLLEER